MWKRGAKCGACCVVLVLGAVGCRELVSGPPDAESVHKAAPETASAPAAEATPVALPMLLSGREHVLLHEWLRSSTGMQVQDHKRGVPVPIQGGMQIPGGPFLHVFLPGPASVKGMGEDVEPGTITHFKGFVAMA